MRTNDSYVENEKLKQELQEQLEPYLSGQKKSMLINVIGSPGAGKSKFLQHRYEEYNSNEKDKVHAVYIEASACDNEVDVLRILVANLQKQIDDIQFDRFHYLYQWFYGKNARQESSEYESIEEAKERLSDESFKSWAKEGIKGFYKIAHKLLEKSECRYPFHTVIELARFFYKADQEDKEIERAVKALEAISGDISNERGRRKELCRIFKADFSEWAGEPGKQKILIFMDNFCIDSSRELHRNLEWLTGEDGLLEQMHSAWIIGARKEYELQEGRKITLYVNGFDKADAEKYIRKKCRFEERVENYQEYGDKIRDFIRVMMDISEEKDEHYYLPFKLNIMTDHFNHRFEETNNIERIDVKEFRKIEESDEFVGRYYYMDLPEHLLNVAQILSCLNTWNRERIDMICQRFHHYLFHTKYFLESNLPIEYIDDEQYKLHEAIREALYKNKENAIKHDVQEYIFEEYMEACSEKGLLSLKDMKLFRVYGELLLGYLEFMKERKERETEVLLKKLYQFEKLNVDRKALELYYKKFLEGLDSVYNDNKGTSNVTADFTELYKNTVERFGEIFHAKDQSEKDVFVPDYILRRLDLANLYSDLGFPGRAVEVEKKSLQYTEMLLNYIETTYPEASAARFEVLRIELKCKNAMAYEESYKWEKDEAFTTGKNALQAASKLLEDILNSIDEEALYKKLEILNRLNAEKDIPFIPEEYDKLVNAFTELVIRVSGNGKMQKIAEVLLRLLSDEIERLRGNFPWYCIKCGKQDEIDILGFAKKTYQLRKAQADAFEKAGYRADDKDFLSDKRKRVLTAYHNIGVYALKLKNREKAFAVLENAVEKRREELGIVEIKHMEQMVRKRELEELIEAAEERTDAKKVFWEIIHLSDKSELVSENYFTEHEDTLESIQYLGNCYLGFSSDCVEEHKTDYEYAVKYLGQAFLNHYIRQSMENQKTLDCGVRLAAAIYLTEEFRTAQQLMEQIVEFAEKDLKNEISSKKREGYRQLAAGMTERKDKKEILKILEIKL